MSGPTVPVVAPAGKEIIRKEEELNKEKMRVEKQEQNKEHTTPLPAQPPGSSRVAVAACVGPVPSRPACCCTPRRKETTRKEKEQEDEKRRVEKQEHKTKEDMLVGPA